MPSDRTDHAAATRRRKVAEAVEALTALQFGPRQRNETAAYAMLALLDLRSGMPWSDARAPLRGLKGINTFVAEEYGRKYAENTRETIRDDAVKFFVEEGLLLRNPDKPNRPTTSGKTVYQVEPTALALLRTFGTSKWPKRLTRFMEGREALKHEISRKRQLVRIPVTLPNGSKVTLSPGGQNTLIKDIIEQFCPAYAPGGVVLYIGDSENKFTHLEAEALASLGVRLSPSAKIPDVIVHYPAKNWLLLIEATTSAGPVDGKRRKELKEIFAGCRAGLVFVTAFESRRAMQSFLSQIAWESEVWIAEDPDHMIHFNGERFLGPYPDVCPNGDRESP
ncbi:MAG: hypothetical protein IT581_09595 [Verrucomicrobiales bacterium]|nr:hypothetical protein [Verrucomicrobiales bacterium]